jgi:hypothetical protein
VLVIMAASAILYNQAWRIDNDTIHQLTAYIAGLVLFASIGYGPLYVYPTAFFRGASLGERVLASLVTPLVWNLKEVVRVSEVFTWGESLYYGLNPIFLLCLSVATVQMGVCEMVCRWLRNRRIQESARIVTPASLIAVIAGLAGVGLFIGWDMGVHWFYIYQEGYKALFT